MQNIPVGYQPYPSNTVAVPATGGSVNIIINNPSASLNPNGANINNSCSGLPGQAYPPGYYINNNNTNNAPSGTSTAQVPYSTLPIGQQPLNANTSAANTAKDEKKPMKDIVQLTDEYIQTLENYLRNPNPEIKLMGAKELMKRFREDESRKNDVALTNLLNLTLQSKYSPVKMVGMTILDNGWAQGDDFTRQLLNQIQQSSSGYGLDALDAASAALKSAENKIKVPDNNPKASKEEKKSNEVKNE